VLIVKRANGSNFSNDLFLLRISKTELRFSPTGRIRGAVVGAAARRTGFFSG